MCIIICIIVFQFTIISYDSYYESNDIVILQFYSIMIMRCNISNLFWIPFLRIILSNKIMNALLEYIDLGNTCTGVWKIAFEEQISVVYLYV